MKSLEEILAKSKKAIIIGIGGGGDIVGTIPTAKLLEQFNIEYILGGLPWERSVFDPKPGPRVFNEILNCKKLNESVWIANKHTTTSDKIRFAESGVSEVLDTETLLVNIVDGIDSTVEGLLNAAESLDVDLIIGIDVGGDAIGFGNEEGLMSPLADAIMTSVLYKLSSKINTIMGIFGFGSDGELTLLELENSFSKIAQNSGILGSWGITQKTLRLMEKIIKVVPTEASKLPVLYAKGEFENTKIRSGSREVDLNISSTITFYLDPKIVFEKISKPSRAVINCKSLKEANTALNNIGIKTELDLEVEKLNYNSK